MQQGALGYRVHQRGFVPQRVYNVTTTTPPLQWVMGMNVLGLMSVSFLFIKKWAKNPTKNDVPNIGGNTHNRFRRFRVKISKKLKNT